MPLYALAQGLAPIDEETYLRLPAVEAHRAFLPDTVDLSGKFPTPGDQGSQGSCVGWAVGYAARTYYEARSSGGHPDDPERIASPAFVYDLIRDGDCDTATSIYDALQLLKFSGALNLRRYPYDESVCGRKLPDDWRDQTDFHVQGIRRLESLALDNIKGQLAAGHPVILSIKTTDAFHALNGDEVFDDAPENKWGFGHALTAVGYDEHRQAIRVINSWGVDWADGGFGWISYDSLPRISRYAYVMRPEGGVPPLPQPPPEPDPTPEVSLSARIEAAEFSCADISVTNSAVRGFVDGAADLERLRAIVREHGPGRAVEVQSRPWPQCEALMTLTHARTGASAPRLIVAGGREDLSSGDLIPIEVVAPNYPSYLYLVYVQANGEAIYLHQPKGIVPRPTSPGARIRMGDGQDGRSAFRISPPFGDEMIVAIAAQSPLFQTPRDTIQTERSFLTDLRRAVLAAPPGRAKPRAIAITHATVGTSPASP